MQLDDPLSILSFYRLFGNRNSITAVLMYKQESEPIL